MLRFAVIIKIVRSMGLDLTTAAKLISWVILGTPFDTRVALKLLRAVINGLRLDRSQSEEVYDKLAYYLGLGDGKRSIKFTVKKIVVRKTPKT
ncbi:unnamed protein product [Dicrocoelium dendriticum]|nr:unnamed protein product [Dicrocoelium dendriticum]